MRRVHFALLIAVAAFVCIVALFNVSLFQALLLGGKFLLLEIFLVPLTCSMWSFFGDRVRSITVKKTVFWSVFGVATLILGLLTLDGVILLWQTLVGLWTLFVAFLVIWFYLAPRNLYWTFVKEDTAKVVVRGDEATKALVQFGGYTLDREFNVIPGQEWHLFGVLRFYGLWPLYNIYLYDTLRRVRNVAED